MSIDDYVNARKKELVVQEDQARHMEKKKMLEEARNLHINIRDRIVEEIVKNGKKEC